jgi:hypothetical protein
MRRSTLLFALALLLWGAQAKASSLIVNGSFEQPVLPIGGGQDFTGGSTGIPGWTVVGVDIGLLQTKYSEPQNGMIQFNAQDGLNSVDLTGAFNTGPTDGIKQTVTTTPGSTYDLSFWVGRAQSDNGFPGYQDPVTVDLSLNGGTSVGFTNNDTPQSRLCRVEAILDVLRGFELEYDDHVPEWYPAQHRPGESRQRRPHPIQPFRPRTQRPDALARGWCPWCFGLRLATAKAGCVTPAQ